MRKQSIFKNLQIELLRAGITQGEIAIKIGMTPTTFTNKMRGSTQFSLPEIIAVQKEINSILNSNYTLDYLFAK